MLDQLSVILAGQTKLSDLSVLGGQEIDGVFYCKNFLGRIVRNFAFEFFFKGHHEFNGIKTVSTQIINKTGCVGDFVSMTLSRWYRNFRG